MYIEASGQINDYRAREPLFFRFEGIYSLAESEEATRDCWNPVNGLLPSVTGAADKAEGTKTSSQESTISATSVPRPLPPSLVPRGQVEVIHGEHQRQNTPAPPTESGSVPADSIITSGTGSQPSDQLTFNGQRRSYASRDLSNAVSRDTQFRIFITMRWWPIRLFIFRSREWTNSQRTQMPNTHRWTWQSTFSEVGTKKGWLWLSRSFCSRDWWVRF